MNWKFLALLMGGLLVSVAQADESGTNDNPNAWLRTDVMQAAYEINMTDDQRARFAVELRRFVESYQQSVDKVLARSDVADPAGRIERRRNSLAKKMDRSMADILHESQMPAYQKYRGLLLSEMSEDVDAYFQKPSDENIRIGNPGAH